MALTEADLRGLLHSSPAPTTSSTTTTESVPDNRSATPAMDDFQGFDPRGTLNRRRAPSSSSSTAPSTSAPKRSPSLHQKSATVDGRGAFSQSPSALNSGLLRRSSALRQSQSPPVRQVGFPSPSPSPSHNERTQTSSSSPCPTDGLTQSLAQQSFFPPQEATVTARSGSSSNSRAAPLLEDPPLHRGRRLSRPGLLRASSESSSLEFSSLSRSRSRHNPSLRDQLFERDSRAGTGAAAAASSSAASNSPMSSYCEVHSDNDNDSLDRPTTAGSTPWSPAQEFLSNLGRTAPGQDTSMSLMDSVLSLSSDTDKFAQGVEVDGWKIGHFLGAGSFGHVRTCRRLDGASSATGSRIGPGQLAAVKVVPLSQDAHLTAEIDLWSTLPKHEYVLPLLGVYTTENTSFVFMPLCEGGNLLEYLRDFGESGSSGIGPVRSRAPRGRRSISSRWSNVPHDDESSSSSGNRNSSHGASSKGGLPLKLVKHIFTQVVSGLAHLHANKVTHCDVKLENILLDNKSGRFRLADFGMAQAHAADLSDELLAERDGHPASFTEGFTVPPSLDAAVMKEGGGAAAGAAGGDSQTAPLPPMVDSPAGSLEYAAPERLKVTASTRANTAVDIWALGCVLYALISGHLPFQDAFEPRLRMKIMGGTWEVPTQLVSLSRNRQCEALLQLLQNCLHMDEAQRWTVDQVQACEWMTTSWADEEDRILEEERITRSNPRRSTSRSQSRGRRQLVVDTADENSRTASPSAEYSPYRSEYRQHRSRSRESSSGSTPSRRRRDPSSGPPTGCRVPMTLSE